MIRKLVVAFIVLNSLYVLSVGGWLTYYQELGVEVGINVVTCDVCNTENDTVVSITFKSGCTTDCSACTNETTVPVSTPTLSPHTNLTYTGCLTGNYLTQERVAALALPNYTSRRVAKLEFQLDNCDVSTARKGYIFAACQQLNETHSQSEYRCDPDTLQVAYQQVIYNSTNCTGLAVYINPYSTYYNFPRCTGRAKWWCIAPTAAPVAPYHSSAVAYKPSLTLTGTMLIVASVAFAIELVLGYARFARSILFVITSARL